MSDVLNIPRTDFQATPEFEAEADARFISGMAKAAEKMVVLLDIDRVLVGTNVLALAETN